MSSLLVAPETLVRFKAPVPAQAAHTVELSKAPQVLAGHKQVFMLTLAAVPVRFKTPAPAQAVHAPSKVLAAANEKVSTGHVQEAEAVF